ncbi:MAG: ABC transporter transmembrane domain-containing protein [Candidatus Pacebacteria bacterium]|nr:ABC transporter transmembrane domain-containing protein [Candidatus Paceibacterota bacterium]
MNTYLRALKFIKYEKGLAISLFIACLILSCLTILEPFFFKEIINNLISFNKGDNFFQSIRIVFVLWIGTVLLNTLMQIFISYNSSVLSIKSFSTLWEKTFKHILGLSVNFFQNNKLGSIVRDFERGLDNVYMLHANFFRHILINIFLILILLPILFYLNLKMALLILATIPVLSLIVIFGVKNMKKSQRISDKKWSELTGMAYDSVSNIFLVQSFTLASKLFKKGDKMRAIALNEQVKTNKWWGGFIGISRSIGLVLNILVFFVGSYLFVQNEISLGDIIMFVGFTSIIINIFNSLFWNVIDYSWQREKINAFFEVWDAKPEIVSKKNAIEIENVKGEIEFKNVSFRYKDGADALKDISFKINPGEVIAFVGHTGSGKTTTANLISRFYDINKGKILIDGTSIKDIELDFLRKNIAIVFQENTFFNASFLENLRIDNKNTTKRDIEEACKKAHIWEVIQKSRKGLDQIIGDRGIKLSGGEKQRLSIARAILKDSPILILDEATSALDAKTEHKIQLAISNLVKGRTTIIIAHRLSTIKKADRIFVFDNGKVVENGNFDFLMEKKGKFYDLASHQITI